MKFKLRFDRREILILLVVLTAFPTTTLNALGLDKMSAVFNYFNQFLNF